MTLSALQIIEGFQSAHPDRCACGAQHASRDITYLHCRLVEVGLPFELDEVEAELARAPSRPVTSLETWGPWLSELLDAVEVGAARFRLPERSTSIGSIHRNDATARSCQSSSGDGAVIVDVEALLLAHLTSKCFAMALPVGDSAEIDGDYTAISTDPNLIMSHLGRSPDAARHFANLILVTLARGRPSAVKPFGLDESRAGFASSLCTAAELFLVAHEYAHLSLGHHDSSPARPSGMTLPIDTARMSPDWILELEADAWGAAIAVAAAPTMDIVSNCFHWGVELYFAVQVVLEMARVDTGRAQSQPGTHPPAHLRLKAIRRGFESAIPAADLESYRTMRQVVPDTVFLLWMASVEQMRHTTRR